MKQTAVEWLVSELKKYDSAGLKDQSNYVIEMPTYILTELEEQAKEMEKQQGYSEEDLEKAFKVGFTLGYGSDVEAIDEKDKCFNRWFKIFKNK
jgi:hypothetical protein